jgi:hypothetical protein
MWNDSLRGRERIGHLGQIGLFACLVRNDQILELIYFG